MTFVHLSGFVLLSNIFSDFNLIYSNNGYTNYLDYYACFFNFTELINNIVALFFYKAKYPIKTYNLYPFIIIKPNRIKLIY